MKHLRTIFMILILFSCDGNKKVTLTNPIVFSVEEFDVKKNQMKVSLEIINSSNKTLNENKWSFHWNQMSGHIIPESLPKNIEYKYINGQGYFILNFKKGYSLEPNNKISISFTQNGIVNRTPFKPMGGFLRNHETNELIETPITFNWKNGKGVKSLNHDSNEKKFKSMNGLSVLPKEKLNWIIPSPKYISFNNTYRETFKELIIYSPKSILLDSILTKERLEFDSEIKVEFSDKKNANTLILHDKTLKKNEYSLNINNDFIEIRAIDGKAAFYALESLHQILLISKNEKNGLPIIKVKDSPRFNYRGFLLDVSRNFYGVEKVKQVLDYMAHFKLNKLDFRLTDDEGWRIEIPGIPELTEIGSKRGYTEDESDKLIPMYGSGPFSNNSGSGFYSKEDFIEILRYASKRNIEVIPQICFPSHARAAVKSMESRYNRYLKENDTDSANEYLLNDPNDKSKYRSAQLFNDNIINICQNSSYSFFEKVVSELKIMYNQANLEMKIFNIGADEVPYGVWQNSPICNEFLSNNKSIKNLNDLYTLSLSKLNSIIEQYGAKMAGWDDIILQLSEKNQSETKIKKEMLKLNPRVYVWNNTWGGGREDMIYKITNAGFEAVMSNSSAFYFDMAKDYDFESLGLSWSGYIDYKDTWGTEPFNVFSNMQTLRKNDYLDESKIQNDYNSVNLNEILKNNLSSKTFMNKKGIKNFIGIQSQLWSETIVNEDIFDALFMPNLAVFSERAWSKKEKWTDEKNYSKQSDEVDKKWNLFSNTLAQRHLNYIHSLYGGLAFDLTKPGAIISNDTLYIKTKFPGINIRYSTNGKTPTPESKEYISPVKIDPNDKIKVRTFDLNGRGGKIIEL